ncbi:MAG TPA: glycosyltransferase family 4 protein [bacterium]|nr:glycosyltransferase family 4 protein [bacterium]HQL62379.1 glycosyltransferase family 4 protein [bacterium]
MTRVLFIAHNGYGYPHSRVRCYHFARMLSQYPDFQTSVLSFRQDLAPHLSEEAMYFDLRDRHKLVLTLKAIPRLLAERHSLIYIQKAHFHSAAPFFLHRLGFLPRYVFDYDDYDIPLSNFFGRGIWNRIFFGSNRWDEITYRHARRALGCVASSFRLKEFLSEYHPRVVRIPTGVDADRFTPGERMDPDVVYLWNGLIWGEPIYQNVQMILRWFPEVVRKVSGARLWIVGDGRLWDRLQADLADRVDFPVRTTRAVPPDRMPEILRQADVGLLPIAEDTEWAAAKSPTKLFEYMASGLAVVAGNIGEVRHVIEHGNDGFLAQNEEEFVDCLVRVGRDASLRKRIGMNARLKAEREYSLPVLGSHLAEFLRSLLQ